jgi:hypothetical protein
MAKRSRAKRVQKGWQDIEHHQTDGRGRFDRCGIEPAKTTGGLSADSTERSTRMPEPPPLLGRDVCGEQRLRDTPPLLKSPSGYVQQSPWMAIANKQLELMGRYMTELGMTPASRSRVAAADPRMQVPTIEFRTIYEADPVADFKKEIETMASPMEPEP